MSDERLWEESTAHQDVRGLAAQAIRERDAALARVAELEPLLAIEDQLRVRVAELEALVAVAVSELGLSNSPDPIAALRALGGTDAAPSVSTPSTCPECAIGFHAHARTCSRWKYEGPTPTGSTGT